MGFLKKVKRNNKKQQKEMEKRVEDFKKEVGDLGRKYGVSIVPINTKYGLELEIQVLSEEQRESIKKKELEKGKSQDLAKKL